MYKNENKYMFAVLKQSNKIMLRNLYSILVPATFILLASCGGAPTPNSCFKITKKLGYDKASKTAKVEEIDRARMGDTVYFVACDNKDQFYSVWTGDKGYDKSLVPTEESKKSATVSGISLIKSDTLASIPHVYKTENTFNVVFVSSNISSDLKTDNSTTSEKKIIISGTNPGYVF